MPILVDDITSMVAAPAAATPKYFNAVEFTGSGKAAGLLNQNVRPGRYPLGSSAGTMSTSAVTAKTKSSGSNVTTFTVPLGVLAQYSVEHNAAKGLLYPVPFDTDRYDVTNAATKLDYDVFLDLTPQGIVLHKDDSGEKMSRDLNVLYRMELYVLAKGSTSEKVRMVSTAPIMRHGNAFSVTDEFSMMRWSYAPLDDIVDFIADATRRIAMNGTSVRIDLDEIAEWMSMYDVYERICRLAEAWSGDGVADTISDHITGLFANGTPDDQTLHNLAMQLRYLETYNVSLAAYRKIHATIHGVCPPDVANSLSKQNLNLLMSHTLEHLNSMKPQLSTPPTAAPAGYAMPAYFSAQQRAAIATEEPLVLAQAGAGTGKSTVILGRIEHLTAHGVDPKDITVLSFTNAAADNITAKSPNVGSMTIARMIHDIYILNHPTHELSSIDTILNSIDIFYPNSDLARAFRRVMMDVDKLQPGATTLLNAFIEKYEADVMGMLDRIKQTCLELEIVIAYQQIDRMVEPPHVQSKYLIIDEVQDNSIFEFIYLLKYVTKHKENMYLVGDASQTLYEFRASNPKALNALEESGVFATFKLTTNYRSNQEILDFANGYSLSDIEANRTAQLRLQANSLLTPTAKSFQEKVIVNYKHFPHLSKFREELPTLLATEVRGYIEKCLARGEQVAFLAYTRDNITSIENKLKEMFPNEHVANLVSTRSYPTTVFSQYIKTFWNDVCQVDPAHAAFVIHKGINDNLDQLTKNAAKAAVPVAKMVSDWWAASGDAINGWVNMFAANQLTADEFFDRLRGNVLDYEIRHNGIKQSLMNQRNRERKEQNLQAQARLVVSTIHGAKGLEFDNVVVIHKLDAVMKEEDKRMYYVAFTRAMKSMYVLAYGNSRNPRIESDYKLMVDLLEKRDALTELRSQGFVNDTMSDDEVEAALATFQAAIRQEEAAAVDSTNDDDGSAFLGGLTGPADSAPASNVNPAPDHAAIMAAVNEALAPVAAGHDIDAEDIGSGTSPIDDSAFTAVTV